MPRGCASSSTAVGIRCKDGVVFGVEKIITSKLHESASNRRIFTVDRHIGVVRCLLELRGDGHIPLLLWCSSTHSYIASFHSQAIAGLIADSRKVNEERQACHDVYGGQEFLFMLDCKPSKRRSSQFQIDVCAAHPCEGRPCDPVTAILYHHLLPSLSFSASC